MLFLLFYNLVLAWCLQELCLTYCAKYTEPTSGNLKTNFLQNLNFAAPNRSSFCNHAPLQVFSAERHQLFVFFSHLAKHHYIETSIMNRNNDINATKCKPYNLGSHTLLVMFLKVIPSVIFKTGTFSFLRFLCSF